MGQRQKSIWLYLRLDGVLVMNQVKPLAFPFPVLQCSMGDKNEEQLEWDAPPEPPAMVMNPGHPGPASDSMG